MTQWNARRWRPLLVLVILLAFALRVYHLDTFSFWQDEGLTPWRASYSVAEIFSNRIVVQEGVTKDTHPPLYYLLVHFTQAAFGRSDFAYRYPSVLAGVLLVPLLFHFGRRLHSPAAGGLAAALVAVSPWQVWYAQEARMYTLMVLLGAAGSATLWQTLARPPEKTGALLGRLALYGLWMGLAIYTHYTAVFLIVGQACFWAWLLWRRGHRRLIVGGALAGLLAALPLLPFTAPRFFTGKEANYYYVPPWIMLQDVVHAFGLGPTVDLGDIGIVLLDVITLAVLVAGVIRTAAHKERAWLTRSFLLVYLLATVFGLMLGSLVKPMYLGARHTMIGSPAFYLLLALGLLALPRRPARLLPLLAGIMLVVGPAVSLRNLYQDPSYAKDDLRALVRTIEQNAGGRDVVLYNNAILMITHQHYRQRDDLAVAALPVYPYMAGPDTETQLEALVQQYERIWFVPDPPADDRDDNGVVRQWLEENALWLDFFNFRGRTMNVDAILYQTRPPLVTALPADAQVVSLAWPGVPPLMGWRAGFDQPAAVPSLWLELYWQGGASPSADQQLRFRLHGPDDSVWLDHNESLLPPQGIEWPGMGLVRLAYRLPIPAGTPSGVYSVWLQPWDEASGAPAGDPQQLTTVTLAASNAWPLEPAWPFAGSFPLRFDGGLELVGVVPADAGVRPGHTLPVSLYWRRVSEMPPARWHYELEVVGDDGRMVRRDTGSPGPSWLEPAEWPLDAIMVQHTGLYFPPETEAGRYHLRWRLFNGNEVTSGRPGWRPWWSQQVTLGAVEVAPWPLVTEAPTGIEPVAAEFGPAVELLGYRLSGLPPQTNGKMIVTLFWRANATPDDNYMVFVHLVGADGVITAQSAWIPAGGLRPTKGWRPGEVIEDAHQLALPADLPAGEYSLRVGFFHPETQQRLPVSVDGRPQPDNQLLLATVSVR